MQTSLISIITRTQNGPGLLRAKNSLSNQQKISALGVGLEWIVVNDSAETLPSELRNIEGAITHVTTIEHGDCLGRAQAAQSGINAAQGEWIGFLDDDDYFFPEHLINMLEAIENRQERVVYAAAQVEVYSDTIHPEKKVNQYVLAETFSPLRLRIENYIPIFTYLFHSSLKEKVRFDPQFELYEDWDFLLSLSQHGDFYFSDHLSGVYVNQQRSGIKGENKKAHLYRNRIYQKWLQLENLGVFFDYCLDQNNPRQLTYRKLWLEEKEGDQKHKINLMQKMFERKLTQTRYLYLSHQERRAQKEKCLLMNAQLIRLELQNHIDQQNEQIENFSSTFKKIDFLRILDGFYQRCHRLFSTEKQVSINHEETDSEVNAYPKIVKRVQNEGHRDCLPLAEVESQSILFSQIEIVVLGLVQDEYLGQELMYLEQEGARIHYVDYEDQELNAVTETILFDTLQTKLNAFDYEQISAMLVTDHHLVDFSLSVLPKMHHSKLAFCSPILTNAQDLKEMEAQCQQWLLHYPDLHLITRNNDLSVQIYHQYNILSTVLTTSNTFIAKKIKRTAFSLNDENKKRLIQKLSILALVNAQDSEALSQTLGIYERIKSRYGENVEFVLCYLDQTQEDVTLHHSLNECWQLGIMDLHETALKELFSLADIAIDFAHTQGNGQWMKALFMEGLACILPFHSFVQGFDYGLAQDRYNAFLVDSHDAEFCYRALCILIDSPEAREKVAAQAQKDIQPFTIQAMAEKLLSHIL